MTTHRDNLRNHPEPLPDGYDPGMVQVDQLLSREAQSHAVPAGLADRIAEASTSHLPAYRTLTLDEPQPAVQTSARSWSMLSRLAMAASVGLALFAGAMFLRTSVDKPLPGSTTGVQVNGLNGVAGSTVAEAPSTSRSLSAAQEWVLLESVQLAHYSEVRGSSLSEVHDDLNELVRELEM